MLVRRQTPSDPATWGKCPKARPGIPESPNASSYPKALASREHPHIRKVAVTAYFDDVKLLALEGRIRSCLCVACFLRPSQWLNPCTGLHLRTGANAEVLAKVPPGPRTRNPSFYGMPFWRHASCFPPMTGQSPRGLMTNAWPCHPPTQTGATHPIRLGVGASHTVTSAERKDLAPCAGASIQAIANPGIQGMAWTSTAMPLARHTGRPVCRNPRKYTLRPWPYTWCLFPPVTRPPLVSPSPQGPLRGSSQSARTILPGTGVRVVLFPPELFFFTTRPFTTIPFFFVCSLSCRRTCHRPAHVCPALARELLLLLLPFLLPSFLCAFLDSMMAGVATTSFLPTFAPTFVLTFPAMWSDAQP